MMRRIRVLQGRSWRELSERAVQACRILAERAGAGDHGRAVDVALLAAVSVPAARTAPAALAAFRSATASRFFAGAEDPGSTAARLAAAAPKDRARTCASARRAADGRFDLLGHTGLTFGAPIDWSLDPVRGRRSPAVHWSRVRFLDPAIGDHKVIWELNRHQWLVEYALAALYESDARWAARAFDTMDAWISANPPKAGVNWASSLELAFRAISWTWTLALLRDDPALTEERFGRYAAVLALHGRHVAAHLSTWFSPNTHLTGEAVGLLYLGSAFPFLRDAAAWRAQAREILVAWMPRHVRADGTYIEQSTHYARYTADFLIHAVMLLRLQGEGSVPELELALSRVAHFLRQLVRPDGTLPLLGDDDGGRLLFLARHPVDDLRSTLATAGAVLDDPALRAAGAPAGAETAWITGAASLAIAPSVATPRASLFFPEGGVWISRDKDDVTASCGVVDVGPHGMGHGGHAHADLLAIDLSLGGRPLLVDSGTFTYTMDHAARDAYRGASAHATVTVDGHGSALPAGPFSWSRVPNVTSAISHLSTGIDALLASHDGFAHGTQPVRHSRLVLHAHARYWLLADLFDGAGTHAIELHFPLAPGLEALADGATLRVTSEGQPFATLAVDGAGHWSVEGAATSRAYGAQSETRRATWRTTMRDSLVIVTAIGTVAASLHLSAGHGGPGVEVRVRAHDAADLLLLRPLASVSHGGVTAEATAVWLECADAPSRVVALDVRRLACGDAQFVTTPVSIATARRSASGWTAAVAAPTAGVGTATGGGA